MMGRHAQVTSKVHDEIRFRSSQREVRRGAKFYLQGDSANELLLIVSGHIKVTMTSREGRNVLLSVHGPGEFVGETDLLNDDRRTSSAFALTTPTEVLALDRRSFEELFATDLDFAAVVSRSLARKMSEARSRQLELSVDSVLSLIHI